MALRSGCGYWSSALLHISTVQLILLLYCTIGLCWPASMLWFASDGLGFSVHVKHRFHCSAPQVPNVTDFRNWPAGTANLGALAFTGGVFDGSFIWLVPRSSDRVIRIDPATGTMKDYRSWPAGTTNIGNRAFLGGVFDGSTIWLVPHYSDRVVRIATSTGVMQDYRSWPSGTTNIGSLGFIGGVFDGSFVWLFPCSADRLVRIDPSNGLMTGYKNWPVGTTQIGDRAFYGGAFDGFSIWLVPYLSDRVVRVNTSNGVMKDYRNWPVGTTNIGNYGFAGGVFDGSAVWLVPCSSDRAIRIDPSSGTMTGYRNWPTGVSPVWSHAFIGGVFDGSSIWLVPYHADRIIRIDPLSGNMTGYRNWPSGTTNIGSYAFAGGVFDGSSVWLVPCNSDRVLKVQLKCLTASESPTKSFSTSLSVSQTSTPSVSHRSESWTPSLETHSPSSSHLTETTTSSSSQSPSDSHSIRSVSMSPEASQTSTPSLSHRSESLTETSTSSSSQSLSDSLSRSSSFLTSTMTDSSTFVDYGVKIVLLHGVEGASLLDSRVGVRPGHQFRARLSLRRLPQQEYSISFFPVVIPAQCLTVASSNISFTRYNGTLFGDQLFVALSGCSTTALGFQPWWPNGRSMFENYTTPPPTNLTVLPPLRFTLKTVGALSVGTLSISFACIEATPLSGTELIVAFTVQKPHCLRIDRMVLKFNSTSSLNQSFTLYPMRRASNLNVSVSVDGSAAQQYDFRSLAWFLVSIWAPRTATRSSYSQTSSDSWTSELTVTRSRSHDLPIPALLSFSGKPLAYGIPTLLDETSSDDSRTLTVTIQDEIFFTNLTETLSTAGGNTPQGRGFAEVAESLSQCFAASATASALLVYFSTMSRFALIGNNTFNLTFKKQSGTPTTTAIYYFRSDEFLTLTIFPRCVSRRSYVRPAILRFSPLTRTETSPLREQARVASVSVKTAAVFIGSGSLVMQTQRAMTLFGMVSCQTEFDESLGFLDNPFLVSIGPASYGQFVAAMTLNHLLIYGVPVLHVVLAAFCSRFRHSSLAHALVWARFPSLSTLAFTYWGSSTATAATIIAIYSPEPWHRPVAVASLVLSFFPLGLMMRYLRSGCGATLVFARKRASRGGPNHPGNKLHRRTNTSRLGSLRGRITFMEMLEYFMEGGRKWKDRDETFTGYCRANRLLFEDYTEQWYWFGVVEIGVGLLTGVLMGIKLGPGQCIATLCVFIAILAVFLIFVLWKRPYKAPFASLFSILTTLLQLVGASFLAGWMVSGRSSYREFAEASAISSLYLLVGKTGLDGLALLLQIGVNAVGWVRQQRAQGTHQELSDRLLVSALEDTHPLTDHTEAAVAEESNVDIDLELPEQENEDVDLYLDAQEHIIETADEIGLLHLPQESEEKASEPNRRVISSHLTCNPNPLD